MAPAADSGPPLDHPTGEDQEMVLTHYGGTHGLGGGRHKTVSIFLHRGPLPDEHRRTALGTRNVLPVPVDSAALHLGIALRKDKTVSAWLPASYLSIVIQVPVSAAGALHPHHPAFPGLGQLIQEQI